MKLYTEEQVIKSLKLAHSHITSLQNVIDRLKHIELPTDDEIDEESPYVPDDASMDFWSHKEGFVDGAKWMRDKIQGNHIGDVNKMIGGKQ